MVGPRGEAMKDVGKPFLIVTTIKGQKDLLRGSHGYLESLGKIVFQPKSGYRNPVILFLGPSQAL